MEHGYGRILVGGLLIFTLASATACSIATAAMRSQIASQCGTVGLKGCPEMAERAIAYAGGNQADGEAKLRAAAAQNSPDQLRQFTKALAPILAAADDETAGKLRGVIAILAGNGSTSPPAAPGSPIAQKAAQADAHAKPAAAAQVPPSVARPAIENLRAGMVNPWTEGQLLPCDASMSDAKTCGRVRVISGPLVLTNLYASGGCTQELFVTSADSKPQWTLLVLASDRMNVTGHFPVEEGQWLYAGARGNTPTKNDPRCAIVWSGFRPMETKIYETLGDGD